MTQPKPHGTSILRLWPAPDPRSGPWSRSQWPMDTQAHEPVGPWHADERPCVHGPFTWRACPNVARLPSTKHLLPVHIMKHYHPES